MGGNQMITIMVEGMSCQHCKNSIESAVGQLNGVTRVTAHPDKAIVEVDFQGEQVSVDDIAKAIEEIGFTFVKVLD
jgi:copper chaperone